MVANGRIASRCLWGREGGGFRKYLCFSVFCLVRKGNTGSTGTFRSVQRGNPRGATSSAPRPMKRYVTAGLSDPLLIPYIPWVEGYKPGRSLAKDECLVEKKRRRGKKQ